MLGRKYIFQECPFTFKQFEMVFTYIYTRGVEFDSDVWTQCFFSPSFVHLNDSKHSGGQKNAYQIGHMSFY